MTQSEPLAEPERSTSLPPAGWVPSRAAGLARLEAFLPRAGRAYAEARNVDRGPLDRANISGLSPWIRRRLVTEEDVLTAVQAAHGHVNAEKFIQEVFWRTYWKGWLEHRPQLLVRFEAELGGLRARLNAEPGLRAAVERACAGDTGIVPFDTWAHELIRDGWMHNHARMWFASIWIFTLELPWQLGADFFFRHLVDADPAVNTLSWRWVAGLHTPGKHYLATARNIRANTAGRFDPEGLLPGGLLNERAGPLAPDAPPPAETLRLPADRPQGRRVGLLLHEEDLNPETLPQTGDVVCIAGLTPPSISPPGSPAARFQEGALADGLARAQRHFACPAQPVAPAGIVAWARGAGLSDVAAPYAPAGLTARALAQAAQALAGEGIGLVRLMRGYDWRAWPHATAGFFRFKAQIPALLADLRAP